MNFKKARAFGFALVNFVTATDAEQALEVFTGLMLEQQPTGTIAEWSLDIQGRDALIEKYRDSAVMHDDVSDSHRPLLLHQGCVVPFPKPTQPIWAPWGHVQFCGQAERATPELSFCTTLVIRKLGRNSSREQLMELLNGAGFASQFDFVYVPRHFARGSSFGFGVVNFVNHEFATEALRKIAACSLFVNRTTLTAAWSDSTHGLAALLHKYRNNKVMRRGMPESFQPVVLSNGVPIPYPVIS
jgi:hypothetical protein